MSQSHSQSQVTNLDIEEQPLHKTTTTNPKKRRRCIIAIGITLLIIFLLFLTGLILALTVFKVHDIQTKLTSVTIEGIAPRITFTNINIELNITLNLQIQITNLNYASFRHETGQSFLLYEGVKVGEAIIDPGLIKARGDTTIGYRLKLQVDELADEIDKLFRDVMDGELVLVAQSRVPGRVNILGVFKRNAVAYSDCEIGMDVLGMKVIRQDCNQRTKL